MKELILVGAGNFAAEVARYVAESGIAHTSRVGRHLSLPDEEVRVTGSSVEPLAEHVVQPSCGYVLALSNPDARQQVIESFVRANDLDLPNVVHSDARVMAGQLQGVGNIIGPFCYIGINATLGNLNVLNAFCSIGHHSTLGSNNFFAPDFHIGNSVRIGDDNFFGIGSFAVHELAVGSCNRVQAGTGLSESVGDGQLVTVPTRPKQIGLYRRITSG